MRIIKHKDGDIHNHEVKNLELVTWHEQARMKPSLVPVSPEAALMLANTRIRYWSEEAYKGQSRIKFLRKAMKQAGELIGHGKQAEAGKTLERALKPKRFKVIHLASRLP